MLHSRMCTPGMTTQGAFQAPRFLRPHPVATADFALSGKKKRAPVGKNSNCVNIRGCLIPILESQPCPTKVKGCRHHSYATVQKLSNFYMQVTMVRFTLIPRQMLSLSSVWMHAVLGQNMKLQFVGEHFQHPYPFPKLLLGLFLARSTTSSPIHVMCLSSFCLTACLCVCVTNSSIVSDWQKITRIIEARWKVTHFIDPLIQKSKTFTLGQELY